ncbi:SDR family oxidoreductase [Candidatus Gottesmanbacteria bacterium]|nr:SDR family oxidoreductase [Candidatus Gottesmanbacteria bacterium]
MKIPILGTGLSGMVGSRIVELLSDKYEFADLSFNTRIDITSVDQVLEVFKNSEAATVLHLAAKTDVDSCEDDKILTEEGPAWLVNVEGTRNIVEAAQKYHKRVIYISSDFVFDGTEDFYTEEDVPNPVNWYGVTKYEGEKILEESGISHTIVRLAYPYRANFPLKSDFVRRIIEAGKENEEIKSLTDHFFTPTFIDDFAKALDILLQKELPGIFHLVGSQTLTPYEAVGEVFETFGLQGNIIPITRAEYFRNRAFRPCRLALKNDKITKLGVKMHRFDEGLLEVKKQMSGI